MRLRWALAIVATASSASAAPKEDVHACVTASERGQRLREKLLFKAARDEFVSCSRDVCPAIVRAECAKWSADMNDRIPSIVIRATDGEGHDVTDVKVYVDDVLTQTQLDGKRIEVDPGPRKLRFVRIGQPPKDVDVLVREGEHNRSVDVSLGIPLEKKKKEEPKPPPEPAPFPIVAAALAGVAVLGGVGFAVFASSGNSDVKHLRDTCAPQCAPSDVDSARTKIIVANVSLAVGILALAGAGYFFFLAPSGPSGTAGATAGVRF
jgi:hypothetical protein